MKEIRNYIRNMNGFDTLNMGLVFLSALLFAFLGLVPVEGLYQYHIVGYLPMAYCIFRLFSPASPRRRMENERFEQVMGPLYERIISRREIRAQKKVFRFYHCPVCSQTLRVPKGKGRVEITCPNCDHKFVRNT